MMMLAAQSQAAGEPQSPQPGLRRRDAQVNIFESWSPEEIEALTRVGPNEVMIERQAVDQSRQPAESPENQDRESKRPRVA